VLPRAIGVVTCAFRLPLLCKKTEHAEHRFCVHASQRITALIFSHSSHIFGVSTGESTCALRFPRACRFLPHSKHNNWLHSTQNTAPSEASHSSHSGSLSPNSPPALPALTEERDPGCISSLSIIFGAALCRLNREMKDGEGTDFGGVVVTTGRSGVGDEGDGEGEGVALRGGVGDEGDGEDEGVALRGGADLGGEVSFDSKAEGGGLLEGGLIGLSTLYKPGRLDSKGGEDSAEGANKEDDPPVRR